MKNLFRLTAVACWLLMLSGCGGGDDAPDKIKPTNLTLSSDISEDGTGLVSFTATADNAAKYYFSFGDGSADLESTDGTEDHTYATSGTYSVRVVAKSTDLIGVEKSINVEVEVAISDEGYKTELTHEGYALVWNDEFTETTLNSENWKHETGGGGWGNHELEYYQAANTKVKDGYLTITAKKESAGGMSYTSSRIVSAGKKDFKYGRIDIRAILPKGQGLWPALWMLGSSIGNPPWPACGEIDIMEMIGGSGRENTVYGTPHWSDPNGNHASLNSNHEVVLSSGTFADKFHVFTIIWTDTRIDWYMDDVKFGSGINTTPSDLTEFNEKFFFIMNVAVGGDWPGSPNSSTVFPQRMVVDYVRVFQEQEG